MKFSINGATTMPYTLPQDLQAAAEAGFNGVEIWWDKVKDYLAAHELADLVKEVAKYDLIPVGICPFLVSPFRDRTKNRQEFEQALTVATAIQCDLITVCPDYRPMNMTKEAALKRHAEEFAWYAQKAQAQGIRLAIEALGGHTLVPGPKEALALIKNAGDFDNLGLVMDTFHYTRTGVTEQEIGDIPVERLFLVHINDSEVGMADELQDKNRLFPLEGCLDLTKFRDLLGKMGYAGFYSVEVFRPQYWEWDIAEINEQAIASVRKLFI